MSGYSWSLANATPLSISVTTTLGGTVVVLVALPAFLIGGWRLEAWGIAAALWVAYLAIGVFLGRVPLGEEREDRGHAAMHCGLLAAQIQLGEDRVDVLGHG